MSPHPRPQRRLVALTAAAALAAAMLATQAGPAAAAPGKILNANAKDAITDAYIVVYKDSAVPKSKVRSVTDRLAKSHKAAVGYRYTSAVRGFSAKMSRAEAQRLTADPSVAFVEQDQKVSISATQSPTPSWGLDRIDQRDLPLNNSYTYPNTGSGVTAYIIDTGIRTTHSDFGGRAVFGTNTAGDGNNTDCNGHGTHVAGTVGGTAYGVAKGVRLVAVKVLACNGSGSNAGVIAGIDWVTSNHISGPAVANMSLGGGASTSLDSAVRTSIADGVTYAIASGNSNANACNFSPARVTEAITVNATTRTDARASYSNYGTCTDIFAPGSEITSAWITSDTATNTISGTSMATPHVAGAAALILNTTPTATPAQVWNTMSANSTLSKVTNPGTGSPNRLLYIGGGTTPPAGCAPVTNPTDVTIPDNTTVSSGITIAGCAGTASASSSIEVHIVHTYRGDLVVDLVAPGGAVINLSNRAGGSADNIDEVFSRNLSGYTANGVWTLRVRDAASADVGYINSWTLDV
ncbi:MAG TPA: S8 family serine peptidase [Propionibacteriaceae bacterium]